VAYVGYVGYRVAGREELGVVSTGGEIPAQALDSC